MIIFCDGLLISFFRRNAKHLENKEKTNSSNMNFHMSHNNIFHKEDHIFSEKHVSIPIYFEMSTV